MSDGTFFGNVQLYFQVTLNMISEKMLPKGKLPPLWPSPVPRNRQCKTDTEEVYLAWTNVLKGLRNTARFIAPKIPGNFGKVLMQNIVGWLQ